MKIILGMVGAVTMIVCVALALFFFLVGVIDERDEDAGIQGDVKEYL